MLTIIFDSLEGEVVPDGRVKDRVDRLISEYKMGQIYQVCIGSNLIMDYVRLAVKQKRISHNEIRVISNGVHYDLDESGQFYDWPPEMEVWDDVLNKLIGWRS